MSTKKRVLATSAALASVGAGVLGPADPAAAHRITITLSDIEATVGPGHAGIRLCRNGGGSDVWPEAVVQWHVYADGTLYGMTLPEDLIGCRDRTATNTITNFRICLQTEPDHRWTYPPFPHTCTGWKRVT
jgi:hypothetical protein